MYSEGNIVPDHEKRLESEATESAFKSTSAPEIEGWDAGEDLDLGMPASEPLSASTARAPSLGEEPQSTGSASTAPKPADGWEDSSFTNLEFSDTAQRLRSANKPGEDSSPMDERAIPCQDLYQGFEAQERISRLQSEASSPDSQRISPWHSCWAALFKQEVELDMCSDILWTVDQANCALISNEECKDLVELTNGRGRLKRLRYVISIVPSFREGQFLPKTSSQAGEEQFIRMQKLMPIKKMPIIHVSQSRIFGESNPNSDCYSYQ